MSSASEITSITSFPYVAGPDAHLLILGSMPSTASLNAGQYYAHPRNSFWLIMGILVRFDISLPYDQKLERLKKNKIALWDVVHRCRRPGSLDANIHADTVEPNDFQEFFSSHAKIRAVFFNGQAAANLYQRHVLPLLEDPWRKLPRHTLPSTSPANAVWSLDKKLTIWKQIIDSL